MTLTALSNEPVSHDAQDELRRWCTRIEVVALTKLRCRISMLRAVADVVPFQVAYFRSKEMERLADRLAREPFDLAFGHMFRMLPYLERFRDTPRVMDLCDSLAANLERAVSVKSWFTRPAFREELRRVARYECTAMSAVDESWVATELDRTHLHERDPNAAIELVPNGIETRWGMAGLDGPKEDAALFLGNLTVGHNVDAATYLVDEVWPRVLRERPNARLYLVGAPSRAVLRFGARPGITVVGFAPDLGPFLRRARVSIAPIRYGAGIQNKVLETMAAGLPAVVSSIVAGPIGAEHEREILVADSPGEIATEVGRALSDEAFAQRIGDAGSRHVLSRFSWARAGDRLRELLR